MESPISAKQIFEHLSPYDLERVTFLFPDGLPVVVAYIDTDEIGGATITLSDQSALDAKKGTDVRLSIQINAFLPHRVTASEALALYHRGFIDDPFLLMAKDWRMSPFDDDFEELIPDELDDPDFLTDFARRRSNSGPADSRNLQLPQFLTDTVQTP